MDSAPPVVPAFTVPVSPVSDPGPSAAFAALVERVAACRRCPSMDGRRRVLGPQNGPLDAPVLFIAEAPGRFGADVTGVPLSGDRAGRTFEWLLTRAGLRRAEVFITNAVLCNPRDDRGRNRTPSRVEVARCRDYLQAQIDLVHAPVIVPLGRTALAALARIEPHGLTLREAVGRPHRWRGRILVPLYHPGDRALRHRPLWCQERDYQELGRLVRSLNR